MAAHAVGDQQDVGAVAAVLRLRLRQAALADPERAGQLGDQEVVLVGRADLALVGKAEAPHAEDGGRGFREGNFGERVRHAGSESIQDCVHGVFLSYRGSRAASQGCSVLTSKLFWHFRFQPERPGRVLSLGVRQASIRWHWKVFMAFTSGNRKVRRRRRRRPELQDRPRKE